MLKRFGIFIFVFLIIGIVMVFSKENHYIKSLNVNESDIIYFKNENSSDATNFKTNLSPSSVLNLAGTITLPLESIV